jgi:hypothetical protein
MLFSCSSLKRVGSGNTVEPSEVNTLSAFCDNFKPYKTLYISGINAEIQIENEIYNSRVSLYYLPDSLFLLSAANSGFEIVRLGVTPDSTVYINRLDKLAYVIRNNPAVNAAPVLFADLEYLVNKQLLCTMQEIKRLNDSTLLVDHSEQDISKKIYFSLPGPQVSKFEFFQKKTGEYVVGEFNAEQKLIIYSNYIVDNLTMQAEGGVPEYDKILEVNLSVNKRKYNIIYL